MSSLKLYVDIDDWFHYNRKSLSKYDLKNVWITKCFSVPRNIIRYVGILISPHHVEK